MDNDIDAQIRDILMKSTPINDNSTPKPQPTPLPTPFNFGINVVGNQNIVVETGALHLLFWLSFLICFLCLR